MVGIDDPMLLPRWIFATSGAVLRRHLVMAELVLGFRLFLSLVVVMADGPVDLVAVALSGSQSVLLVVA